MDVQLSNYTRGKAIEIVIVGCAAALPLFYSDWNNCSFISFGGFSVLIPFIGAFAVTIPVAAVGLLQFGFTFDFWLLIGAYIITDFRWIFSRLYYFQMQ